ncbi:MAG TPA: hypothetical protein VMA34_06705 [Terracidiphilus sp.]|nr:hypothetical protein [Terracidiphilus sp.]
MIAGASWGWWAGFHGVVVLLLAADWLLQDRVRGRAAAWVGTAAMVLAAAGFAAWIALARGRQPALEWATGYTIETSLSADNLFVFLVIFDGFRISTRRQQKALTWGVAGAVLLRGLFIAVGVALLARFQWVTWGFGLLLLYAAWRLLRGGSARAVVPEWIRRLQPAKGSLLPVIVAVEVTDLLFAVDSIPAVLAVTHDPFIVYTSNIAAVIGLRSLYRALAPLLERFRYLHYGLAALLTFVAAKMLLGRWVEIPIEVSLGIIAGVVTVCAVAGMAGRHQE